MSYTISTPYGDLDINEFEAINLNQSLKDIRDITQVQSAYSKDFTIPSTSTNDLILGSIWEYDVESTDTDFDVSKYTPVRINENGKQVFEGSLQLVSINKDFKNKFISYNVRVQGNNKSFAEILGDKKLSDLPSLSALNFTFSLSAITNTWNDSINGGLYFPLINQQSYTYSYIHNTGIPYTDFRPAISAKYLLDYIFTDNGFSFSSSFFKNDIYVPRMYIPFSKEKFVNSQEFLDEYTIQVQDSDSFNLTTPSTTINQADISTTPFFMVCDTEVEDVNNQWSVDTFTSAQPFNQRFRIELNYQLLTAIPIFLEKIVITPVLNGVNQPEITITLNGTSTAEQIISCYTPYYNLTAGSTLKFKVHFEAQNYLYSTFTPFSILARIKNFVIQNEISPTIIAGTPVECSSIVPDLKQIDYFKEMVKMFNLYMLQDVNNPKNFIIEPQPIFYSSGSTVELSIDYSKPIEEKFIDQVCSKSNLFTYKKSEDYLNKDYSEKTEEVYGQYEYLIDNDFIDSAQKTELLFQPLISEKITGSEEIIVPRIVKQTSTGYEPAPVGLRIGYKKRISLENETWKFNQLYDYSSYPSLCHLDHPLTGTTDLNFGAVQGTYYDLSGITSNNLFNRFYKSYFDELSDPDTRFVTAYLNIDEITMQTLSLQDAIFLDGISHNTGYYFRINKIIDYKIGSNESTKCELLKLTTRPSNTTIFTEEPEYNDDGNISFVNPIVSNPNFGNPNSQFDSIPNQVDATSTIDGNQNNTALNNSIVNITGVDNYTDNTEGSVNGDTNVVLNSRNITVNGSGNTLSNLRNVQIDGNDIEINNLENANVSNKSSIKLPVGQKSTGVLNKTCFVSLNNRTWTKIFELQNVSPNNLMGGVIRLESSNLFTAGGGSNGNNFSSYSNMLELNAGWNFSGQCIDSTVNEISANNLLNMNPSISDILSMSYSAITTGSSVEVHCLYNATGSSVANGYMLSDVKCLFFDFAVIPKLI